MKIGVCIPMYGYIPADSVRDMLGLAYGLGKNHEDKTTGIEVELFNVTGCFVSDAREKLSVRAEKEGCDYILWLDADHTFSPDDIIEFIVRYLEQNKYDIVGAKYVHRTDPTKVCAGDFNEKNRVVFLDAEEWKDKEVGYKEIQLLGFGCTIMPVSICKQMREEYGKAFRVVDEGSRFIGEDVWFFNKVRNKSWTVGLDTDLLIGHFGGVLK